MEKLQNARKNYMPTMQQKLDQLQIQVFDGLIIFSRFATIKRCSQVSPFSAIVKIDLNLQPPINDESINYIRSRDIQCYYDHKSECIIQQVTREMSISDLNKLSTFIPEPRISFQDQQREEFSQPLYNLAE